MVPVEEKCNKKGTFSLFVIPKLQVLQIAADVIPCMFSSHCHVPVGYMNL
jgi:hypothetical protein